MCSPTQPTSHPRFPTLTTPCDWRVQLNDDERARVRFAQLYAERLHRRRQTIVTHREELLIAKLAAILDHVHRIAT